MEIYLYKNSIKLFRATYYHVFFNYIYILVYITTYNKIKLKFKVFEAGNLFFSELVLANGNNSNDTPFFFVFSSPLFFMWICSMAQPAAFNEELAQRDFHGTAQGWSTAQADSFQ